MEISLQKAYELVKTPGFPTIRMETRILIEACKECKNIYQSLKSVTEMEGLK